jgi:peptidoglycan hydrolase CwlO-like protein
VLFGFENLGHKNENIHLWLLDLNRKKNRARLLEDANREVSAVPVSILNNPWFNDDKSSKGEVDKPTFAENAENADLDELLKEKAGLEGELRRSDEEIKALGLRVRELYEKIIQEKKKKNDEKRLEIERWRSEIGALETQIGEGSSL